MARIHTESLTINFSRLVKDDANPESILNDEIASTLQAVAEELVGDSAVVEVEDNNAG